MASWWPGDGLHASHRTVRRMTGEDRQPVFRQGAAWRKDQARERRKRNAASCPSQYMLVLNTGSTTSFHSP